MLNKNGLFCISDGRHEGVTFDKITSRIQKLCYGLNCDFVDPVSIKFNVQSLKKKLKK